MVRLHGEEKGYIRVYGNNDLMMPLLRKAGYGVSTDLVGCTLAHIEDDYGNTLYPYMDGDGGFDDGYVSRDGRIIVFQYGQQPNTDGRINSCLCDVCDNEMDEDDSYFDHHTEQQMCEYCYDETHVWVEGESYHIESEDVVEDMDGEWQLSEDCCYSDHDCVWIHSDDANFSNFLDTYIVARDSVSVFNCDTGEEDLVLGDMAMEVDGVSIITEQEDEYLTNHKESEDEDD